MIHKTMRSILSVLLAALLLVTSTPLTPAFADGGGVSLQSESGEGEGLTGSGTEDAPYQIGSAADLREFAKLVNNPDQTSAWAVLTADIVLNEKIEVDDNGTVTNQKELSEWTPIGSNSRPYTGTFDGNGKTISGLYINKTSSDYQGLFGYVSGSGKVQNLSVSGSVSGSDHVGGVVGYNNSGTVENCHKIGEVSGNRYVGGVVGSNSNGRVENCTNTGSVNGSGKRVGGVVGNNEASVENCYNTGTVTGTDEWVGGVVGVNSSSVTNCYNTGSVKGNRYVGGVVGDNSSIVGDNSSNVENCYNIGEVSGSLIPVGGVVGYNDGNVTGCYFLKTAVVNSKLQGIGGDGGSDENAAPVTNLNDQNQFQGWDFADTWRISKSLNRPVLQDNAQDGLPPGLGTEASPYEISTATQLENFRDLVNGANNQTADPDAHAKLMNNIDLNPDMKISEDGTVTGAHDQWTPIGNSEENAYTGNFDGNGHKIENLYIKNTSSDTDYQGLFGYVGTNGKIENLTVEGSITVTGTVTSGSYVGGVVGCNNGGIVTGCTFSGSGTVTSDWYVGGVVGYNNGGTVTGCTFSGSGSVSGSYHVGGIVGQNRGSVENCYNTGAVSGPDSGYSNIVGGVVGWNDSGANVENCYNTGTVSGPDSGSGNSVGGVVGYNDGGRVGGRVENCYNTGAVSGPDSGSGDWYVGGVVGYNRGSVTNCYNTDSVTVTGSGSRVGGVVGYNNGGSVTNCYFLKTADVNKNLSGIGFGGEGQEAIQKTADAFHSGEVAWRLQAGQKAAVEEDPIPQVWGQSNLTEEDSWPTLIALNPGAAQPVYKVTFKYGYDDAPADEISYTNGSVKFPTFERTGYAFAGWTPTGTTISQDTTFTAQWAANTYTVTLHTNDGTIAEGQNISSYTYGIGATLPTSVTREGYTFAGWYEKEDFTGDPVAAIGKDAMGDKTYWAKWEEVENPEPDPTPTPSPDPTPSGPSTDGSSGWDDICDELENAENGDEITIDMGDETKVPAEIFESLAGKDVEISFDLGDIQWSVNGADIPTDTDFTDLDLGASLGTRGIPVNVINTITGEVGTVQITLAHNGEFGFTMTLTAPLGKENAGYWANLYHYDEDAEALNFEVAAKIDEDGSVTIPFSHASQYAIVIDTHSHATVDVSDLFSDIAPNAWYKDAIQYAYDNGLMTGVSATEFAPEQTTTRAMIVSILARLEGVTTAQAAGFADVDDEWYATAVNWAANVGVVNGYEDNTFRPNTAITREQLAAILMNYASYKGEDVSNRADLTSYTDQPSAWATETMSWAVAEGLISGVTNTELQPQGNATRAQVAAILQRYLEA